MVYAGTAFVRMVGDFSHLNRQLASQLGPMERAGSRMGKALSGGLKVGLAGVAVGAFEAVRGFTEFNRQMTLVATQAGAGSREVHRLEKSIVQMSTRSRYNATELAKALYYIESHGFRQFGKGAHDGTKALQLLDQAQKFAAVGGVADLQEATRALTGAMKSGIKGTETAAKTVKELHAAVGQGSLRMNDLIAALGTNFVQSARSAGLGLRDVTAALAVLTRQGATAQLSATRLRYAFSLLAAPTDKAKKALGSVGLGAFQLAEDMRKPNGLLLAVQDLRKHLATLKGGAEGIAANDVLVKAFGGARSFATIVALVQHTKDLKDVYKELGIQAENFQRSVRLTEQTPSFKFHEAWNRIQAIFINLGSKFAPAVADEVQKITHMLTDKRLTTAERFSRIGEELNKGFQAAGPKILAFIREFAPKVVAAFVHGVINAPEWTRLFVGAWLVHRLVGWGNIFAAGAARVGTQSGEALGASMTKSLRIQLAAMEAMTAEITTAIRAQTGLAMGVPMAVGGRPVKGGAYSRTGYGSGKYVVYGRGGRATTGVPSRMVPPVAGGGAGIANLANELEKEGKKPSFLSKVKGFGAGLGSMLAIGAALTFGPELIKQVQKDLKSKGGFGQPTTPKGPFGIGGEVAGQNLRNLFHGRIGDQGRPGPSLNSLSGILHGGPLLRIGPQMDDNEKKLRKFGSSMDDTFKKLTKARDYKGLRLFGQQAQDAAAKARELGHADWGTAFDKAAKAVIRTTGPFQRFLNNLGELQAHTKTSLGQVTQAFSRNLSQIPDLFGKNTKAGQHFLTTNLEAAVSSIKSLMHEGVISTKKGLDEINKLFMQTLIQQYGLSPKDAKFYSAVSTQKPGTKPGDKIHGFAARGAFYVGKPGETGADNVPLNLPPGSVVLNAHQQAALGLARGGVPVVVGRGELVMPPEARGDLSRLTSATGYGNLRSFFSTVNRPHYLAKGGFAQMVSEANQINKQHYPYVWGGGHNSSFSGPYDCSGAVSAVIHAGGLLDNPLVSGQFMNYGLPGPGKVTIYSNPKHVYMSLGGKFFGTHGAMGAGWFKGSARKGFTVTHVPVSGGDKTEIARVRALGGTASYTALRQAGMDMAVGGANKRLSDVYNAAFGGGQAGGGDPAEGAGKAGLARLWRQAGGPPELANMAAAIALAESGGDPNAHNASGASGLWQILGQVVRGNIFNPIVNARNAVKKWRDAPHGGHNFLPWVTYTSGAYRQFLAGGGLATMASSGSKPGPNYHWVAGHRAKNPGGHGSHYVKGHWAHNPGSTAHKAPPSFPKHSQKGPKIKLPKFPKHIEPRFPRKGVLTPFVWPNLGYERMANYMGDGAGSITALMEGEDVRSQIFDRTEETFIRTEDADGNPIVPTIDVDPHGFFGDIGSSFPVNRRIGELSDLIGREVGIKGLIDEVAKTLLGDGTGKFYPNNIMASGLQVLAREGVKHFKAQIVRIKRRVRAIIKRVKALRTEIKSLRSKITTEAKKKNPNGDQIRTWRSQLVSRQNELVRLEGENIYLTGSKDTLGDAGDLALEQTNLENFVDYKDSVDGWVTNLVGSSGTGGTRFDVDSAMYDLQKQLSDLSSTALAKALKAAGPGPDTGLSGLLQTQSDQFEHAYRVSQAQYGVLSNLSDLFGGSFKYGGVVPGPLGAARMIMAHGGETVTPADSYAGGGEIAVHIHPHGGLADLIDTRVERVTRRQSNVAGRRLPGRGGGN